MAVVVFGSINMDLVVRTPQLPDAGQTLIGRTFTSVPGGKGANQAVAAARLGATTRMVGHVGDDMFGTALLGSLQLAGVDVRGVQREPGSSGVAAIAVDDRGENTILVVPGANSRSDPADLSRLDQALLQASVLLLQLEIPLEAVVAAARMARQHGVLVILDPAPARDLPAELYTLIDLLTPNASEAALLSGVTPDHPGDVRQAASILLARGPRSVVIKLGGQGAYWTDGQAERLYPAFPVHVVDTVAAGDAFNGAVAAALDRGLAMPAALWQGMAAGALATTRAGAQAAMPDRAELDALLDQYARED